MIPCWLQVYAKVINIKYENLSIFHTGISSSLLIQNLLLSESFISWVILFNINKVNNHHSLAFCQNGKFYVPTFFVHSALSRQGCLAMFNKWSLWLFWQMSEVSCITLYSITIRSFHLVSSFCLIQMGLWFQIKFPIYNLSPCDFLSLFGSVTSGTRSNSHFTIQKKIMIND